jgi:exo-1,4-beta-D-glucosaminidase
MYEAVNHRMWDITSGFSEWCLNSCFPTVQWQMYDWYLRPTVSYYYIKKACEPRHVQLSPLDRTVSVINVTTEPLDSVQVTARLFDLRSKLIWQHSAVLDVPANSCSETFSIEVPDDITPVYFVQLELRNEAGELLSENFYWLPKGDSSDLGALNDLEPVGLETAMTLETRGDETIAKVKVRNSSNRIAFFAHLVLTDGAGGEEILPVLWDDNYFSLTPGQSRELTAKVMTKHLRKTPQLEIGGWNIESPFTCVNLSTSKDTLTSGEELIVKATITDTFLDGSDVSLFVDDEKVASKLVYARDGDDVGSREVQFRIAISNPGSRTLRVGNCKKLVRVE